MTSNKFADYKKYAANHADEILVGTVTLAAIAAVVAISKTTSVPVKPLNFCLDLPKSAVDHMLATGEILRFETPKLNLNVQMLSHL